MVKLLNSESLNDREIKVLAILSCIKVVSAINSYLNNGNSDKAKTLLANSIEELKKVKDNIRDLKSRSSELVRKLDEFERYSDEAVNYIQEFNEVLKRTILSNPSIARICIRIQPHLEIMFTTLNNIIRDLKASNESIRNNAFRDAKSYLRYIDSYLSDLLRVLKDL